MGKWPLNVEFSLVSEGDATAMMVSPFKHELVSVIIPSYNHASYLGEAIDSVTLQTYPHTEVIVVDDGSTDETALIMATYPSARYVRQDNMGVSHARNTGLSLSRGSYVLFLDADDRLLPDAIEIGLQALDERKSCAFAFGLNVSIGSREGVHDLPRDKRFAYEELLKFNFIENPGSVLYHRWVFSRVGKFDEANGPAADYDLYLRIAGQFPIICHHRVVVEYRKHAANMSRHARTMLKATLTALKRQQKHVKSNCHLKDAYNIGRQYYKHYYGEPVIVSMYENLARGNMMGAVCDCYALIRFFPERFLTFLGRKAGKLYCALRNKLFPKTRCS